MRIDELKPEEGGRVCRQARNNCETERALRVEDPEVEPWLVDVSDRIRLDVRTASEHEEWSRIVTACKSQIGHHAANRDSLRLRSSTRRPLPTKAQLPTNSGREKDQKKSKRRRSRRGW